MAAPAARATPVASAVHSGLLRSGACRKRLPHITCALPGFLRPRSKLSVTTSEQKDFPSHSHARTHTFSQDNRARRTLCRLHTAAVTPSEDVLEQGRLRPSALLQAHLPRSVTLNLEQGRQRTSSMTSYSLRQAASARVGAHPNPQTPGFTGREGAADLLDDVVLPAPGGIRARGRAPRLRRQPLLAAEQPGLQLARGRAEPQLRAMQTEVLGTVSYWLTGSRAARSPARARPR